MEAALVDLPIETLQTWLAEALQGRHDILALKKPYQVSHAGQSRYYNHQALAELDSYISKLQGAINAKTNSRPVRGPIYFGMGF